MYPARPLGLAALILAAPSPGTDAGIRAPLSVNLRLRTELLALGEGDRAAIEASLSSTRNTAIEASEHIQRIRRLKEIIHQFGGAEARLRDDQSVQR